MPERYSTMIVENLVIQAIALSTQLSHPGESQEEWVQRANDWAAIAGSLVTECPGGIDGPVGA